MSNRKALLGKKLGMSQVWDENGFFVPVTLVDVSTNVVTAVKTEESDGYKAVQLGYGAIDPTKVTKPLAGHFAKAGVTPRSKSNGMIAVATTQRRGAAGMGGRTHAWTNAWDPGEDSYAQQVFENAEDDVFVFYRNPDLAKSLRHRDGRPLDFNLKSERLKMLEYVYRGSPWVDLNSIESEAKALMKTDPTQAERFFGNRLVQGGGAWLEDGLWESCYAGA